MHQTMLYPYPTLLRLPVPRTGVRGLPPTSSKDGVKKRSKFGKARADQQEFLFSVISSFPALTSDGILAKRNISLLSYRFSFLLS